MKSSLPSRFASFTFLNITQFLGALNDNIYKLVIAFFLIDLLGVEHSSKILASAGAIFVIPFLLISSSAGKLADRYSKRNIIILTKSMEVIVMALGMAAFAFESIWGSYAILFLMATQSSLFSPAKYGIIPELVKTERISQANGLLTFFTFLAIIVGTFLAAFITDVSGRNYILIAGFCTTVAIIGMVTSFYIEYTEPVGNVKRLTTFFLIEIYKTIIRAKRENRLISAILGSAFFLFLGAFIQLNIIPYSMQSLGLSDTQGGYLFLITALGIGAGSMIAGRLSGKHVELGLVPIGGFGMSFLAFLLHAFSESLSAVIPLVILIGIFGGIWIVPLDSFIQVSSPENYRGQMIATTNFLSFLGVLGASGLLYFLSDVLMLKADEGFLVLGILALIATVVLTLATLDYFLRFIAFTISRLCFRLSVTGYDKVPKDSPALILCNRSSSWIDTLLLTAAQRPPLRFIIESNKCRNRFLILFFRAMRVILIPKHKQDDRKAILEKAKKGLDKGYTVCLFAKNSDDQEEEGLARYLDKSKKFLEQTPYAIIPVRIDEKPLHPPSGKFLDLLKEFPWEVTISFDSNQKR